MDDYMFVSYNHDPRIYRAVKDGPVDRGRDDVTFLLGTRDELSVVGGNRVADQHQFNGYAERAGFPMDQYGYRVLTDYCVRHTMDEYLAQPHIGDAERALTPDLFRPKGLI